MSRVTTVLSVAVYATLAALAAPSVASAQLRGAFAAADANHDGHVTLPEFETYASSRLMAANGPVAQRLKQLSPQQQDARLQQRFAKLDHGNKGYLVPTDWGGP